MRSHMLKVARNFLSSKDASRYGGKKKIICWTFLFAKEIELSLMLSPASGRKPWHAMGSRNNPYLLSTSFEHGIVWSPRFSDGNSLQNCTLLNKVLFRGLSSAVGKTRKNLERGEKKQKKNKRLSPHQFSPGLIRVIVTFY